MLGCLKPLQQRSRRQHVDSKIPWKVAYVAGYQGIGLAGEGDFEKRKVVRVWQLRRARDCCDVLAVSLKLPQNVGHIRRI